MVYTGKPSRGCQTCRKRRIKCDELKPVCSQCMKSKRECLGYRDEQNLIFRSENKAVELKVSRRSAGQLAIRSAEPAPSTSRSRQDTPERPAFDAEPVITFPRNLPEKYEQQALCYFLKEFVLVPRNFQASRGYLESLLPLYVDARVQSPLFATTSAVALATLSKQPGRELLMYGARHYYGIAVALLKQAIAHPFEAKSDLTLLSVLLMGLYETMTCDYEPPVLWNKHTEGAAALCKLRGKEMWKNPISAKLFLSVRVQLVISHTYRCAPMESLEDWANVPSIYRAHTTERLNVLSLEIPALRATAMKILRAPMNPTTIHQIKGLMNDARVLDNDISAWPFDIPRSWKHRIYYTSRGEMQDPESAEMYPGPIHYYYDMFISNIWNRYRISRIFCRAIILNCIEKLIPVEERKESIEYRTTVTILRSIVDDICFSVPFNLGFPCPSYEFEESINPTASQHFSRDDSDVPRAKPYVAAQEDNPKTIGAYLLFWNLYIAASVVCIPKDQRLWLNARLTYIGEHHGINQANVLSRLGKLSWHSGQRTMSITDFAPALATDYEPSI